MKQDAYPLYKDLILDLYRHPLNKKTLVDFDVAHREFNPTCGDDISIQIKFDEVGRVGDIGHQGQGCAISQAAVSLVTDAVKGKDTLTILGMTDRNVYDMLGFDVLYTRRNCAMLGLKAIQAAIQSQRGKLLN